MGGVSGGVDDCKCARARARTSHCALLAPLATVSKETEPKPAVSELSGAFTPRGPRRRSALNSLQKKNETKHRLLQDAAAHKSGASH